MEYQYRIIDGIKTAYIDEGEGIPVFFIPPWTTSNVAYEGIVNQLRNSNIRCIRVDLPGWGGNTKQCLKMKDFDSYVNFVADFINAFGYKEYAVLGYSLGATFLLHGIARNLINPKKIVVISSFHGRKNFVEKETLLSRNLKAGALAYKLNIPSAVLKPLVGSFYYSELLTKEIYRKQAMYFMRLINSSIRADRDSIMLPILTLPDVDTEGLKKFKGESLVIYNEHEPWYFKEFTEEIADMMHVKSTVVNGFSGHRYFSFQPESSAQYIKEFILK